MTVFQLILVIVFGALAVGSLAATVFGLIPRRMALTLCAVWLAAAAAAYWPDVTTDLAQLVGIDRGRDLLLYCSVVVMMIGFTMVYVRLRRIRREMTLLVREIAMLHVADNT
ncbi:MAG: DUF2304 domain-containing protein [Phycisphaerales bacterium]|nr:DUF2304 domain-containing protein [Phycisphaerales bacterium]